MRRDRAAPLTEPTAATLATVVAAVMIAQHVAAIATRDAFFLSVFPASDLPRVMLAAAVLSFGVVVGMSRLLSRVSPARAVPAAFLVSAGLFVGEWALSFERPRVAAVVAFLHTAALGAAVISGFWSIVNERFDPHTARRVIGRIGSGAALGGILGGAAAYSAGGRVSLPVMLAGLGAVNALCALGLWRVGRDAPAPPGADSEAPTPSAARVLRDVPYLRHMAALVLLVTVAEVTVDYVFKARAAGAFRESGALIEFFALFYTAAGAVGFAVQRGLASRALARVGLTATIATYPVAVAAAAAVALVLPGLWMFTALRGTDATLKSSLFRSGYELLYTPLTPDKKRPTKTLIDVGCSRLGGAAGSGLAIAAIAAAPAVADRALVGVALAAAVAAALIVTRLHGGYVAALVDSLKKGAVDLTRDNVIDATTLKTLADTTTALRHAELLAQMDELRARLGTRGAAARAVPPHVADLTSGDAARIRRALARGLDDEAVAFAIPLLARDDVQLDAIEALGAAAPRATKVLVDAMFDDHIDWIARRRIPRALSMSPTQPTADGLVRGLGAEPFELRRRCAAALSRIAKRNPELAVPPEPVFAAVRKDGADLAGDDERRLGYLFDLLSLVLEREPLEIAFRALRSRRGPMRGVGLEYLDNILPPDVRQILFAGD